jgi:hypothetical protein
MWLVPADSRFKILGNQTALITAKDWGGARLNSNFDDILALIISIEARCSRRAFKSCGLQRLTTLYRGIRLAIEGHFLQPHKHLSELKTRFDDILEWHITEANFYHYELIGGIM